MPDQEAQPSIDQGAFLRLLDTSFSTEEVKTLCFDLGIKYGNLPGEGKRAKARELISYAVRHGRLWELLERAMVERPNVDWSTVIKGKRQALIVWFTNYTDRRLNDLPFSDADAWSLKRVLNDPEIGQFDYTTCLLNPSRQEVHQAVHKLFSDSFPLDVLLLYVIGHGLVDESGDLYLVTADTNMDRLRGTAISAQYITDEMDRCHSLQKILILDCSYSALAPIRDTAPGEIVSVNTIFKGNEHGLTILTAGNAVQYTWQEQEFVGATVPSPFTQLLIQGLANGAADLDQNGTITVDELYHYISKFNAHEQRPYKWSYGQETSPTIARKARGPSDYAPSVSDRPPDVVQERMLDAAIAREVVVGEPTELVAQVRLKSSAGLKGVLELDIDYEARPEDVKTRSVQLEFPLDERERLQAAVLLLKASSPDFEPPAQIKKIVVPPDGDSEPCIFLLTPRRVGHLRILLEVYDATEIFTASTMIRINCQEGRVTAVDLENRILVSIPLKTIVRSFHEVEKESVPKASPPSRSYTRMVSAGIAAFLIIACGVLIITDAGSRLIASLSPMIQTLPAATGTPTSVPTSIVMHSATPTLFPTPSVEHLLIADFQTCFDMGSADPGGSSGNILHNQCIPDAGRGNTVAQLDYEVPSAWAAFWIRLNSTDFSNFDTLTFYARGDTDVGIPSQVKLELKRDGGAQVNIYNLAALSEEWDFYEIPLENFRTPPGFSTLCSWEGMEELVFTFENDLSDTMGRIYLDNIYLERRQSGAPGPAAPCAPATDPMAIQPPTSSDSLVVSDFDTCRAPNNLGGDMGSAYDPPDSLVESYVPESERGCVARLEYDIQAWSAFWQKLQGQDLTPFSQLTFDLKGDAAVGIPRQIKIELKRAGNSEIATFYVEDITDSWQSFSINLADFQPAFSSWTGMEELVFTFEANGSGNQGVVYLDNVRFQP